MRITAVRAATLAVPVTRPIVSRVRETDTVLNVLLWLDTSEGLTGSAYVAGFTLGGTRAVRALLADLEPLATGRSLTDWEAVVADLWRETRLLGHGGLAAFAVSAIEMALWDLRAQAAGQPLARLLGARRDHVPVYASGGLWLVDEATLARDAEAFAAAGFTAMKMRVGRVEPAADLAAARLIRSIVGDGVTLLADANQGLTVEGAIALGHALAAEAGVAWLEEPVGADDLAGHAAVAAALAIPVASGENRYRASGLEALLAAGGADVLMPDPQRVGGVGGWLAAAEIARRYGRPITPHLFPEIGVHLVAATPEAPWLEWMPWAEPLLAEHLIVRDGVAYVPEAPGAGMRFNPAAVARFRLE
jgi:mandelate racemase